MDDLDRLAFRVARAVRTTYPHLLERGFTLADLEERLAPFAETRRELAVGGPDGYEHTVLRLLAGERGYLAGEPELQAACRRALQTPSPTVALVRTWARSALLLRSGAFALAGDPARAAAAAAVEHAGGRAPAVTPPHADPAAPTDASHRVDPAGCHCHHCAGPLPVARTVRFCPHCGLDLTVRQCPACSTELDRTWRFCVRCGRQADEEHEATASGATRAALAGHPG